MHFINVSCKLYNEAKETDTSCCGFVVILDGSHAREGYSGWSHYYYLSRTMLWNASVGTLRSLLLVTATFPSCPWNLTYHYKAFATSIYRFGVLDRNRDGVG